jgi:hypothetical protein
MELTKTLALFISKYYNKAVHLYIGYDKRDQDKSSWPILLWAIDVPHSPKQRDAKMWILANLKK